MKSSKVFYMVCAAIVFTICPDIARASPQNAPATLSVKIYSIEPTELLGVSRLKQVPLISDMQIIDLSIVPQMEAMFSAHVNDTINRQSIDKIKNLSAQLPRLQLQKLADAHTSLFDLRMRYDVAIDDLPIVIFEQDKKVYLYKGNDAYQGFLLWKKSKK